MKSFTRTLTYNSRELTICGEYETTREVIGHVAYITLDGVKEHDIFGNVVKEKDIDIKQVLEYDERINEDVPVEVTPDDLMNLTELLAEILTEKE